MASALSGGLQGVTALHCIRRLSAEHDNDPMALQEALLEEEKHSGVSHWIGSKIPMSVHNNKIWRTIFWVSCLLQGNCLCLFNAASPSCRRLWLRQSC